MWLPSLNDIVCLLTDACRPQVCGESISRSTAREANWALWISRVCSFFWICWLEELVSEAIQSLDKLYYTILMFLAGILLFIEKVQLCHRESLIWTKCLGDLDLLCYSLGKMICFLKSFMWPRPSFEVHWVQTFNWWFHPLHHMQEWTEMFLVQGLSNIPHLMVFWDVFCAGLTWWWMRMTSSCPFCRKVSVFSLMNSFFVLCWSHLISLFLVQDILLLPALSNALD